VTLLAVSGQGFVDSLAPNDSNSVLSASLPHAINRDRLPNPFKDDEPACDFPIYYLEEWRAANGLSYPDHPAIFRSNIQTVFPAISKYPNFSAVLEAFGDEQVNTQPGYAQAGGHLDEVWPKSKVRLAL